MRKIKFRSVFFHFFISLLIVFFLPIFIVTCLFQNKFINEYNSSVLKENSQKLEQIKQSMDIYLTQLYKSSFDIEYFPISYKNTSVGYQINFNELLIRRVNTIDFIENISVIRADEPYIYTSEGTVNYNDFFIHNAKLNSLLKDIKAPSFYVEKKGGFSMQKGIYYIVPVDKNTYYLYKFSKDFLENILNKDTKNLLQLLIVDSKNIVYPYNYEKETIQLILNETNGEKEAKTFETEQYYICKVRSDIADFNYISYIPIDTALKPVTDLSKLFLLAMIFTIVLGFILVWVLARYNYFPIKRLNELAKQSISKTNNNLSEIEYACYALSNLSDDSSKYTKLKKEYGCEQIFYKILSNKYSTEEEFINECKNFSVNLIGSLHCVAIINVDSINCEEKEDIKLIVNKIKDMFSVNCNVTSINYLQRKSYLFILSIEHDDVEAFYTNLKNVEQVTEKAKENIIISLGNFYESPLKLSYSFAEADRALKYKFVKGCKGIISYKDILSDSAIINNYPKMEIDSLYSTIIEGDLPKTEFILDLLMNNIKKSSANLFLSKCICYGIINTLFRVTHDLKLPPIILPSLNSFSSIEDFHTADEMIQFLNSLCRQLIDSIKQNSTKDSNKYEMNIENIIEYIRKNYMNPDLSVGYIGNEFNISISNLSHYFKINTGQNISEYISMLRLNKAKELLINDNITVKEVAEKVGYFQSSSFIRKFKKEFGVTPANYRKNKNTKN